MDRAHRTFRYGCLALLVVLIGVLIWFLSNAVPLVRYNQRSHRINEKIKALGARKPAGVTARWWDECIAWASIAHCNICFSEEHASYEAMCRFEEQLDQKLKGEVSLATVEWIGERLAETGPHGQQYMEEWRESWESILEQAGQESAGAHK